MEKAGGPNAANKEGNKSVSSGGKDGKDAGKDIPKDDKAKEEAKKAEEMKEMNRFLDKYGGPYLRRASWEFAKADFMDASICRFLRARKWDVDRAMAMLCAALCFRMDMDLEGIIYKGEDGMKDVPGFLNQFRRGISYIRGNTTAPGEYPIYFIRESIKTRSDMLPTGTLTGSCLQTFRATLPAPRSMKCCSSLCYWRWKMRAC